MSAERCGDPTTVELLDLALKRAAGPAPEKELAVSVRAKTMLQKIRVKFPDFSPAAEAEIWRKAYNMGMSDEE
jgi:hypothetical protein